MCFSSKIIARAYYITTGVWLLQTTQPELLKPPKHGVLVSSNVYTAGTDMRSTRPTAVHPMARRTTLRPH